VHRTSLLQYVAFLQAVHCIFAPASPQLLQGIIPSRNWRSSSLTAPPPSPPEFLALFPLPLPPSIAAAYNAPFSAHELVCVCSGRSIRSTQ